MNKRHQSNARKTLVLVGSGEAAFREYALRAISTKARIVLLLNAAPTWEARYSADFIVADLNDYDTVIDRLRGIECDGVLTYDERFVELAAHLTTALRLPGPSPSAVRAAKDKSVLRQLIHSAGLSPIRFGVAHSLADAYRVVSAVGLPAVFKPRALGGSAGVCRVSEPREIPAAFAVAMSARVGTTRSRYDGVLIEEFIDGPEISVDSVAVGGACMPLVVAEKETGFDPFFEEIGHVVPAAPELATQAALDLVSAAHEVAGLDEVVTHTEVRLSPEGPQIIELNVRLGGDLIPYLGLLAHGVDLAGAAADVALGAPPEVRRDDLGTAAVRFLYPETDLRVRDVGLRRPVESYPELDTFAQLCEPGEELLLPPRGYISRLAALVVRAPTRADCQNALDRISSDVVVDVYREL
jgi:predicted ATP-grasp superfamily ATP-dependent carboligase